MLIHCINAVLSNQGKICKIHCVSQVHMVTINKLDQNNCKKASVFSLSQIIVEKVWVHILILCVYFLSFRSSRSQREQDFGREGRSSAGRKEWAHIYSTNCIAQLVQTTCKRKPSVLVDRTKHTGGSRNSYTVLSVLYVEQGQFWPRLMLLQS